jgi:hypothetical protein
MRWATADRHHSSADGRRPHATNGRRLAGEAGDVCVERTPTKWLAAADGGRYDHRFRM